MTAVGSCATLPQDAYENFCVNGAGWSPPVNVEMAKELRRRRGLREHTGRTEKGHTRDVKIKRIGKVTVYKRGHTYYLYYRENGRAVRRLPGPLGHTLSLGEPLAEQRAAVRDCSPPDCGLTLWTWGQGTK